MESIVKLRLGKRGSGKSFYTKEEIKEYNRVLIYDTLGEYEDGIIFEDLDKLIVFWSEYLEKDFKIIYRPLDVTGEFDNICTLVYACGDMVFVAEEIDQFCSPFGLSDEFSHIIRRGRHKNIDFVGVSQRPYGINRIVTSQAKEIVTFIQTEPRDIKYLQDYIGSENINEVQKLEEYEYLKWTPQGTEKGKK